MEQLVQVDDDDVDVYVPTKHKEQTVADEAEYFPTEQLSVTEDSPVDAQKNP